MDYYSWSLLLGLDGLVVDRVEFDELGRKSLLWSTDPDLAKRSVAGVAQRFGVSWKITHGLSSPMPIWPWPRSYLR